MAGSDPKTSRALEQMSARDDIDAEEDPLVELARIVSEDGAFGMAKPGRPKPTRPAPISRASLEDGLEAELLQELETSFAMREPPAAPHQRPIAVRSNPVPAPARAPVAPARPVNADPDPDELLRSIEEQLGQFERRHGRFSPEPSDVTAEPPAAEEGAPDWDEPVEERPAPVFGAPSAESRRGSRIRPFAESAEPSELAPEPEELPSLSAARSDYRFRGPASANWDPPPRADDADEIVRDAFEDTEPSPQIALDTDDLFTQADAEAALAKAEAAVARGRAEEERSREEQRRERITATFPEFEEESADARPPPDLTGLEAGLSRELEPEYSDALPAGKWPDGETPVAESRVAAAIAPGPSRRAAAARAAADRGRSRMGLLTAAGVILVVLIGAGTALYLRSSNEGPSGPPPVITADEGAVRVEPAQDQAATDGETVGDAVYNRVAGAAPETEEQVVESAEEPREVARIVLPPTQTPDEQAATNEDAAGGPPEEESAAAPAPTDAADEIGPRKVPTFVIRADGSIVETSTAAPSAPNPAAEQNQQLANETVPIEPTPVPTVAIAESPSSEGGLPPPTPAAQGEAPAAVDMTPRPSIEEQPAEVAAVEPMPAPAVDAPAAAAEPGTLANAAPEAATPPSADAASGGYLVQLSAQRSMDQAQSAYAAAQGRFPSVLGSLSPQIQEANLGEKGIYFRVRVGPWASRDEAIGVCESLKAAGGSCFVTQ
jgi:hypothetical protein